MVFGGSSGIEGEYPISQSTEIFVNNAWQILHEAPLPIPLERFKGLTLRNEVYAFGKITGDTF